MAWIVLSQELVFFNFIYFDCDFYFRFAHMLKISHLLTLGIFGFNRNFDFLLLFVLLSLFS